MDDLKGEEEKNHNIEEDEEDDPAWIDVDIEKIKIDNPNQEPAKKLT